MQCNPKGDGWDSIPYTSPPRPKRRRQHTTGRVGGEPPYFIHFSFLDLKSAFVRYALCLAPCTCAPLYLYPFDLSLSPFFPLHLHLFPPTSGSDPSFRSTEDLRNPLRPNEATRAGLWGFHNGRGFNPLPLPLLPHPPPLPSPHTPLTPVLKFPTFFHLPPQFSFWVSRQPKSSKRAHLRVSAFQNTTKIPRKDPKREERMKIVAGEGKTSAKFWAVRRNSSGGGP